MDTAAPATVVDAFLTVTSTDPTRPLVTFYDDATGERTELSGATLANWVAKTANLLVDGLGHGPGDVAAVALPTHWQTAAILLGCWSAGLAVSRDGAGPAVVAFASADRLDDLNADETYALALTPLALPFRPGPPPGTLDYAVEVRAYGDQLPPVSVGPASPALVSGETHRDLLAAAAGRGVPARARVLIDGDAMSDPVDWLVAPLVVGTSVVLCRNLDAALVPARLATEHAIPYPLP